MIDSLFHNTERTLTLRLVPFHRLDEIAQRRHGNKSTLDTGETARDADSHQRGNGACDQQGWPRFGFMRPGQRGVGCRAAGVGRPNGVFRRADGMRPVQLREGSSGEWIARGLRDICTAMRCVRIVGDAWKMSLYEQAVHCVNSIDAKPLSGMRARARACVTLHRAAGGVCSMVGCVDTTGILLYSGGNLEHAGDGFGFLKRMLVAEWMPTVS